MFIVIRTMCSISQQEQSSTEMLSYNVQSTDID